MFEQIINELNTSPLLIRSHAIAGLSFFAESLIKGDAYKVYSCHSTLPKCTTSVIQPDIGNPDNPFEVVPEESVALIPIVGNMFKYGMDDFLGMDDIANLIRLSNSNPNIIGTLIYFNTPGGTTQSVIQLEDALRSRTKPSVAFIDGMCCSGGLYVASFCDHIVASNRMCEVGSVGTQMSMLDFSGMYENMGIKEITVRPPESNFKNTEYEEALNGDNSRLIKERLSPFAQHFQNLIKMNRVKLDLSVEGILEGKVFYAYDCINNGLIDSILNFSEAIQLVQSLSIKQSQFYSSF